MEFENGVNEMEPKKSRKGMIAAIIAAIVVLVLAVSVSVMAFANNSGSSLSTIIEKAKNGTLFAKTEKFEPGNMNGNVYVNDYLGIKITLPSNYTIASEADRKKAVSADAEFSQCDLYAYDMTSGTLVMILCEDLEKKAEGMSYTEGKYADNLKDVEKNTGTNAWTFTDNFKTKLAGTEYTSFTAKCNVSSANVTVSQKNLVKKMKNNMITISISGVDETKLSQLEALFEKNR